MTEDKDEIFSISQAASELGVSVHVIYRLIADKSITPRKFQDRYMLTHDDLDAIEKLRTADEDDDDDEAE